MEVNIFESIIDEFTEQQKSSLDNLIKYRNYNTIRKHNSNKLLSLSGFLTKLLHNTKISAINKKLEFNLNLHFLITMYKNQNGKCAISGIPLTRNTNKAITRINNYNISIDRIDSKKGYTKDNIHLVCSCINIMKLDHNINTFLELCKIITVYNA